MHVISAESTELFTGPSHAPQQLVRVAYTDGGGNVRIEGDGLTGRAQAGPGDGISEVPVVVTDPKVGEQRDARVIAGTASPGSRSPSPSPAGRCT